MLACLTACLLAAAAAAATKDLGCNNKEFEPVYTWKCAKCHYLFEACHKEERKDGRRLDLHLNRWMGGYHFSGT